MVPFEQVVTQHGPTVLRVCRAVVGPVDAEDAWAETFLAALKAYPELPSTANVEAWLVTIAHRKAIDVRRGEVRRAIPTDEVPETRTTDRDPTDDEPLYAALKQLPDKQRHAVAYHHLGGLSHREVAEVLGGSEEAARRASADGIKKLRETMRDE
ncbi:MAG: polymerase, sigma-24 subunit, subfamily [Nocardioidaceae bacterium]|nr:polymerase, sigma-24 subunit, subfamily [Nocardioidaceae bacterium]